ncbi:putative leader peptide [Streptomyces marincola]
MVVQDVSGERAISGAPLLVARLHVDLCRLAGCLCTAPR